MLPKEVFMKVRFWTCTLALALVFGGVVPAMASTLVRASLEDLIAANRTILVGEVVDAHSYWNSDHTFILTDVRISPSSVLKGRVPESDVTVTIAGGSVGDLSAIIVGGAELIPGSEYILFLNEGNLPGAPRVLTVRDHCQGVFGLEEGEGGPRAISQATSHPLLPDARGEVQPPGGREGMPVEAMVRAIRETVARTSRQEVN
jgi:hypothetical protein